MTFIALVLLLALGLALRRIAILQRKIHRLEIDNRFLGETIHVAFRVNARWRSIATGGAFAEFIDSLNFNRVERKR